MEAMLPERVIDALQANTSDLQKAGWSQPPGSQWVEYVRPVEEPGHRRTFGHGQAAKQAPPQVARFVLSSPVLPRYVDALSFCSTVHRALVSHSDAMPVFSGCDGDGVRMEGHKHAFLLPELGGDTHRINWLTLYAEMGFDRDAQQVLSRFIEVWQRGGSSSSKRWGSKGRDLRMVLVGVGGVEDFAGTEEILGQSPLLVSSRVWHSVTPFVPTRHIQRSRNGKPRLDANGLKRGSPEHDLRRLLRLNIGAEPVSVEPMTCAVMGDRQVPWSSFGTHRKGGGRRAGHRGYGFRIVFDEPVRGPLALGYGAHFGMGLFAPGVPQEGAMGR